MALTENTSLTPTVCQIPSANAGIFRKVDLNSRSDLEDASITSRAIKKLKTGAGRLRGKNSSTGRPIDFDIEFRELRSKLIRKSDLEEAATGLCTLQNQTRGHAESMDWKWEHLIRCIRILQRRRGCMSALEDTDGVSIRQEKSAYRINQVTNNLSKHIGSLALVVHSAFSGMSLP